MEQKILHMIGNSHIDPVWLWKWPEGLHEVWATFHSVLDRMEEFDDFRFSSSSAAFYEWIERTDPEMFAEIRQRVQEGRWELVGGWWVQPDCNLPGGESFVRQGLYAQRYFLSRFGRAARVGYNVDSFGHHAMLPQILQKSGLEAYLFLRPQPHEKGLPGETFYWQSADGSRLLAARIPFEYCSWGKDLDDHVRRCAHAIKPPRKNGLCFFGVGNHGGGPTIENIQSIHRLQNDPNVPKLVLSTPERFFSAVKAENLSLPIVQDELQHHASGCYAVHSGIKQWNRRAENLLIAAEKFAALAWWIIGRPYPASFERAWKSVLFNQFHDILAGTSLESAYDDARDAYGEAASIAGREMHAALQSLAREIAIPVEEGTRPVVVFNPHAWDIREPVELEFGRLKPEDALFDESNHPVRLQNVQSSATANGRSRLCFTADLPPFGFRTYGIKPSPGIPLDTSDGEPGLSAGEYWLENEFLRVEIDPQSGAISRLFDKRDEVEVFCGQAGVPAILDDDSDTWAHGVLRFDRPAGQFELQQIQLIETGPVRAGVRVTSRFGLSTLTQDFFLYRDLARIDVHAVMDWQGQFQAVKLRFPVNVNHVQITAEIPYGHIRRPANGEEDPCQRWVDLTGVIRGSDRLYGLAIINDGKYSYDAVGRQLSFTVLRSPIYAHHDPARPEPTNRYSIIDQGRQRFTYSLLPHEGGWEDAGVARQAAVWNQPPVPMLSSFHPNGQFRPVLSFFEAEESGMDISVIKKAEDGNDLILRCVELHGEATTATIHLPAGQKIQVSLNPQEIKTLRIPQDLAAPIETVDLLERPMETGGSLPPVYVLETGNGKNQSKVQPEEDIEY